MATDSRHLTREEALALATAQGPGTFFISTGHVLLRKKGDESWQGCSKAWSSNHLFTNQEITGLIETCEYDKWYWSFA